MLIRTPKTSAGKEFELGILYLEGDERALRLRDMDYTAIPYKDYKESIEEVYLQNPNGYAKAEVADPPTRVMSNIHTRICEMLGEEYFDVLKVYPALGMSADVYHGIDALFRLKDKHVVAVDFTLNPAGKEQYGADVFISDIGAYPNRKKYPELPALEEPHTTNGGKEEIRARTKELEKSIASVIANIFTQKIYEEEETPSSRFKKWSNRRNRS